jgi:hypothetical protein
VTDELDGVRRAFRDVPSCAIATVRSDGGPHVASRWFTWDEDGLWVSTRIGDATWGHANHDPRVSIVLERGREWSEIVGVRVEGVAETYPAEHPDLRGPMSAWHEKYRSMFTSDSFERFTHEVPALGFIRVPPARVDAWDHR